MCVLSPSHVVGEQLYGGNVLVVGLERLVGRSLLDILFVCSVGLFDLCVEGADELIVGALFFGDLFKVLCTGIVNSLILLLDMLCMAGRDVGEAIKHDGCQLERLGWGVLNDFGTFEVGSALCEFLLDLGEARREIAILVEIDEKRLDGFERFMQIGTLHKVEVARVGGSVEGGMGSSVVESGQAEWRDGTWAHSGTGRGRSHG